MDILFFGGAFDPVHNGHTAILKRAMEYKKFDKVIVMPTGEPGHKENCKVPFAIRKYMSKLVFKKISEDIDVSAYEGKKLEKSFSYITIDYLRETYPDSKIYFIIGADSAINLRTWKNWEYLAQRVVFLVFARKHGEDKQLADAVDEIRKISPETVVIENEIVPVSSTQIRKMASEGEDISEFVDKDIAQMIKGNNLYSKDDYERWISIAGMLIPLMLRSRRAAHSFNVAGLAKELAEIHGVDVNKAVLAARLHDIMKQAPSEEVIARSLRVEDEAIINSKPYPVLHGYAAADFALHDMGIEDEEILDAMKNHTCGRRGMCDLEKVVYLADTLSPERDYPEKNRLLEIAKKDLNLGMERTLTSSVGWLVDRGDKVDPDSLYALEYFKKLNHGGN